MELTPGHNILRVVTCKRVPMGIGYETFTNQHNFYFQGDFEPTVARLVCEKVALAELHTLMPNVEQLFTVAYWLSPLNFEGMAFQAAAHFNRVPGGRHLVPGDVPVEFPLALLVRSYTKYGRAGKLMFRGLLRERDLRRSDAAGAQLHPNYEESQLTINYFNAFMKEAPYVPVAVVFAPGTDTPVVAHEIEHWGAASVVRLSSVEDAQKRKTVKAAPYREKAHALANDVTFAGQLFNEILVYDGARPSMERVRQLIELLRTVLSGANGLRDYWEQGIEEAFAPCWRPTAGKDPKSQQARAALQDLINTLTALLFGLGNLQPDDEDTADRFELVTMFPGVERAAAQYILMFGRARWTGTPIPHPNLLGGCN